MTVEIDTSDHTAYDKQASYSGRLYFLTHEFKDGCFLGYWSDSPWGRERDQDRGWVVISAEGEVLDDFQTYYFGSVGGGDYHLWRRQQKEEHGPAKRLLDDSGEQKWKMGRG